MTSHKNKAANAAADVKKSALESYVARNIEKTTARNKAENVIYSHASGWAGVELTVSDPIPVVRDNQKVGELTSTLLGGVNEVRKIIEASSVLKTPDVKKRLKVLSSLKTDAEALRDKLAGFDPELLAKAVYAARNMHKDLDGRIIKALGADKAAYIGLEVIAVGLCEQIAHLEIELKNRGPIGKGRASEKAAIDVATAAAVFFARVTGEMPTMGEGPDGLTGKFTPFLRDLYDAFGWRNRTLRAGLEAAIAAVNQDDLTYAGNNLPRGLLSYLAT